METAPASRTKSLPSPRDKFTFTRTVLRDLQPPSKGWAYYYDDVARALTLAVSPMGTKSFLVYRWFQEGHGPVRITLGPFGPDISDSHDLQRGRDPLDLLCNKVPLNIRVARKLATAVNASLDVGVNPAVEKKQQRKLQRQKDRAELTLGELFERYWKDHLVADEKKRPDSAVWMFERYLGALPTGPVKKHGQKRTKAKGSVNWEDRRLSTIHSDEVGQLRVALAKNISPTTSNRVMELLKAIFNFGRKRKLYTGESPAADFPKFKLQSRKRRIEEHEAQKFFETLDAEDDRDFQDYVYLSIYTGARRENVLSMAWHELSLKGAAWRVTGETMKNGEDLVVPLIPEAVEILRRRAQKVNGSPWVFPGATEDGHAGAFRRQWARLTKAAEVPDLRIHDLRHTLGSTMSEAGASSFLVMRALGHKTVDAALVYQNLQLGPVRTAMQAGVRGLLKAAEPEPLQASKRQLRTAKGGQ